MKGRRWHDTLGNNSARYDNQKKPAQKTHTHTKGTTHQENRAVIISLSFTHPHTHTHTCQRRATTEATDAHNGERKARAKT